MDDITHIGLSNVAKHCIEVRKIGEGAKDFFTVADRVVRYLSDNIGTTNEGEKAFVLVRLFETRPFKTLDKVRQDFARTLVPPKEESPDMTCLTLVATTGDQPEWNTWEQSEGHKTIPLSSEEAIERLPMISQLMKQMGLDVRYVLEPDASILGGEEEHSFDVFHVPDVVGSPYVPAQEEFVLPFNVKSVLGYGGLLPTGQLFVVIMFSRVTIAPEIASLFKPLAMATKLALLPYCEKG
jgi:hypothetical protein